MFTFLGALVTLVVGYIIYGAIVDKIFAPTDKVTPAVRINDGVDYIPLPTWKVFMIQLLNIAGLGPIFGALAGALWGPSVYLWIVFGTIFAGGVHDYISGMVSLREDGKSVSEIVGKYLGGKMLFIMRIFSVVLLVLVGTVFATGPAMLIEGKIFGLGDVGGILIWLIIILTYYFLATTLPIDALIARFYPIFGVCLLVMAFGICGALLLGVGGHVLPDMTLENLHPKGLPVWPLIFITVACGAISGFHATQSPLMARCLKSERLARPVFYGAMVAEGFIALVWAAAGIAFYDGTAGLGAALAAAGPGGAVYDICVGLLGPVGAALAMIGVVACPITSGDTAFRSARLTLADWMGLEQSAIRKRLYLAVPLLLVGAILTQMDFAIIWRYFAWTNQTLAMIVLWTGTMYLYKMYRGRPHFIIVLVPAIFMSAVTMTYIFQAPEGLNLGTNISYPVGAAFAVLFTLIFFKATIWSRDNH